jgi:hypothetical protein
MADCLAPDLSLPDFTLVDILKIEANALSDPNQVEGILHGVVFF